jgi:hypothetical protein
MTKRSCYFLTVPEKVEDNYQAGFVLHEGGKAPQNADLFDLGGRRDFSLVALGSLPGK